MKPGNSLERKLVWVLMLSALLFTAVAGTAVFFYNFHQKLDRSSTNRDNLVATVRSSASIAVYVQNEVIAKEVVDSLMLNDEILGASLEGNQGFHLRQGAEFLERNPDAVIPYALNSPVAGEPPVGQLRLLPNENLIAARARQAAFQQVLILGVQTLLFAVLTMFAFRRFIGGPLADLGRRLKAVRPGAFQRIAVPPCHAGDEIGQLSASANSFLEAADHAIEAERALLRRVEAMEHHYRRIFEATSVGIMVLDMDAQLINCNPMLKKRIPRNVAVDKTGLPNGDFFTQAFKDPEKAWALVNQAMAYDQVAAGDLQLKENGNHEHWAHCLFSIHKSPTGDFDFIEGVLYDVTHRRRREEEAMNAAERDPLTAVLNRRGADAFISRALLNAENEHTGVALLYMDLDGFKLVNDRHGHAAGDEVLVQVADRLRRLLRRSSDLIARIGGDEFVVVAYGCRKHDDIVAHLASGIVASLAEPMALADGSAVRISASVGIACFPDDGHSLHELLASADRAMYSAKNAGKNHFAFASDADSAPA